MGPRLTDDVFTQLCTQGYAIVPRYFPEQQRAAMAAALRRLLRPWDQVRDDPPANRRDSYYFPYPEQVLNRAIVDREAIALPRRWLGTEQIQYRPGLGLVTYPGARGGGDTAHIDNGNNSLLPPTLEDRRHSQLNFWFYLEDVDEDQAPTRFLATAEGQDMSRAVADGGARWLREHLPQLHLARSHGLYADERPALRVEVRLRQGRTLLGRRGPTIPTSAGTPTFAPSSAASAPATASCSAFRPPAIPTTRSRLCRPWRNSTRGGIGTANIGPSTVDEGGNTQAHGHVLDDATRPGTLPMKPMLDPTATVGVIANPAAATDIRRVIANATSMPIADRANAVLRVMAALGACGVTRVLMMPENRGIRRHLTRSLERERKLGHADLPCLDFTDTPVTGTVEDTFAATRAMVAAGVAAIVVLGGDGTHRAVARFCAEAWIAGISTGTNNAFPEPQGTDHHRTGGGTGRDRSGPRRGSGPPEQDPAGHDKRRAAIGRRSRRRVRDHRTVRRRPCALAERASARGLRHLRGSRSDRSVRGRRTPAAGGPARTVRTAGATAVPRHCGHRDAGSDRARFDTAGRRAAL